MDILIDVKESSPKEKGKGLFAEKEFKKGEAIIKIKGKVIDHPTRTSIQIDTDKHLEWEEIPQIGFLNHSCSPNCYIDTKTLKLVALRDIAQGEEITFNYNSTEWEMSFPFMCLCGSKNCYKKIRGYKFLTKKQKQDLRDIRSPFLKKLDNE
jgi:SET domain-containing protein